MLTLYASIPIDVKDPYSQIVPPSGLCHQLCRYIPVVFLTQHGEQIPNTEMAAKSNGAGCAKAQCAKG